LSYALGNSAPSGSLPVAIQQQLEVVRHASLQPLRTASLHSAHYEPTADLWNFSECEFKVETSATFSVPVATPPPRLGMSSAKFCRAQAEAGQCPATLTRRQFGGIQRAPTSAVTVAPVTAPLTVWASQFAHHQPWSLAIDVSARGDSHPSFSCSFRVH
jgi:hypothetical protein